MGAIDTELACIDPTALAAAVTRELDPLIGRIDRGLYPGDALRALGAQGAQVVVHRAARHSVKALKQPPSPSPANHRTVVQ